MQSASILIAKGPMTCLVFLLSLGTASLSTGCGASFTAAATAAPAAAIATLMVSPGSASAFVGDQVTFAVQDLPAAVAADCTWRAADPTILSDEAAGQFLASGPGSTQVMVSCANPTAGAAPLTATAAVAVSSKPFARPIIITKGGTYTGRWKSTDPNTAAVMILTDEPVTIANSVITGPGHLMVANGGPQGIHLTVTNVLGVGQNSGVAGQARGNFLNVTGGASVDVHHATMQTVNAGVVVIQSTVSHLSITDNVATNVDDRASDGKGGDTTARPGMGHTIILTDVSAPNGAEIAWNQCINTPGIASVEDVISMYDSKGSPGQPIAIHDNYIQGAVSTLNQNYSGGGILSDGDPADPLGVSAYLDIYDNQVVMTQNYGIGIAIGHDVHVHDNRVISSGKTAAGQWLGVPGLNGAGFYLWNFYGSANFTNNQLTDNVSGLVRQDANGAAVRADLLLTSVSAALSDLSTGDVSFAPVNSPASPATADEAAELQSWQTKVSAAAQTLGATSDLTL